MTQEDKARRYDDAIEIAKAWCDCEQSTTDDKILLKRIFPELKEPKDEEVRAAIIHFISHTPTVPKGVINKETMLVWLEKQEQKPTAWSEEDKNMLEWVIAYLENKMLNTPISEERTACKNAIAWLLEKQGEQKPNPCDGCINRKGCINCENGELRETEQKPANKVEPKFKVGDWIICCDYEPVQITSIRTNAYELSNGDIRPFWMDDNNDNIRLWTIQDAKDGDVLACNNGWTCIFKTLINDETFSSYCFMDNTKWFCETGSECHTLKEEFVEAYNGKIYPATKEQHDLLFQKMKEAGYMWDAEKKELKKIEEEYNGEDYGIDGLWHAQSILEKTLGKVDGYQSDDGILEHKCAISAVKQLYEHKPSEWSEEDEVKLKSACALIRNTSLNGNESIVDSTIIFLKSLKERIQSQPKQEWKQENTGDLTDFENAMMHIGYSFFGQHAGLDPNNTNIVKEQANLLLELVQHKKWIDLEI